MTALAAALVSACAIPRTKEERRAYLRETAVIARDVSITGVVTRRCAVSDQPLADAEVRLTEVGGGLVAREHTTPNGTFTFRAPHRVDARYTLEVGGLSTEVPDSDLVNFSVSLSIPCGEDDNIGLMATFDGGTSNTTPADPRNIGAGPDGSPGKVRHPMDEASRARSTNVPR